MVEDPRAAGLREELRPEPDQAAGGDEHLQADPARAVVDHVLHAPLAEGEELREHADVLLGRVDRDALDGLVHLPVDLARTTCGFPTVSSNPSRRISSTSTASCSSPRPCTSHVSGRSVGMTRSETFPTSSWSSRCFTIGAVSFEPSCPASGDELIPSVIERLGSSTSTTGSGRGSSGSASVSPIVTSGDARDGDDLPRPRLVRVDPVERLGHVELGRLARARSRRPPGTRRAAGPSGSSR